MRCWRVETQLFCYYTLSRYSERTLSAARISVLIEVIRVVRGTMQVLAQVGT